MSEVIEHVDKLNGGWPRRVGSALLVDDKNHGIGWLESTGALFGWLSATSDRCLWFTGTGCVQREELFAELRRTSRKQVAVESLPHEPFIEGHYYACGEYAPGDGSAIEELLDRFNPATPVDRDLLLAAYLTPLWGGHGGARPCFPVTSDAGRGAGKSKAVEMIGHVYGGALSFSNNEDIAIVKTRLLSPDALTKRVALLDNLKSHKFSWAELEALVTAPEIGGKRMYVGEATRPNTLTWFVTLNGASLSTDMAQRSVIIKINRPKRSATWELDTLQFVRAKQREILGDLIAILRRPGVKLNRYTRGASWEDAVLSRLPGAAEVQAVIEERQSEVDVDAEECSIIEDFYAERLKRLDYDPAIDVVHIPNDIATRWFNWATNGGLRTTAVTRTINQLSSEGQLKRLRVDPSRTNGRGLQWVGSRADASRSQFVDVRQRIAEMMRERKDGQSCEPF